MAELDPIVGRLWAERHGDGRPAHLQHVYPSHVRRHLGRAVLAARAAVDGVDVRTATRRVQDLLDDGGWDRLAELAALADAFAAEANRHFAELAPGCRPRHARPQSVSLTACTTVGAAYRAAVDQDGFAAAAGPALRAARERYQEVERQRRDWTSALLELPEFVARYSGYYDELWPGRERDAAVEALRLGFLDRPPMRAARGGGTVAHGWRAGTDRSVADRYKHYRSKATAPRRERTAERAGLDPDRHMSVRLRGADPDRLARGEVERACAPAGLRFAGHRALLGSVVRGLHTADLESFGERRVPRPRRPVPDPLAVWSAADPALPAVVDDELAAAVRGRAESWAHQNRLARSLVGITARRTHSLDTGPERAGGATAATPAAGPWDWTAQVELGVPRRLWLALLHRELEWDAPLTRAELAALLPDMFGRHLRDLVTEPITPPPDRAADDGPDPARVAATLAALHALGTGGVAALVADVRDDRPGWPERYADAVRDSPAACLDPAGLRGWVLANLGEGAPDPSDPLSFDDGAA